MAVAHSLDRRYRPCIDRVPPAFKRKKEKMNNYDFCDTHTHTYIYIYDVVFLRDYSQSISRTNKRITKTRFTLSLTSPRRGKGEDSGR